MFELELHDHFFDLHIQNLFGANYTAGVRFPLGYQQKGR